MTTIAERFNFENPTCEIVGWTAIQGAAVLVNLVNTDGELVTVQAYDGQKFEHPHYGRTDTVQIAKADFNPLFEQIRPAAPQVVTKPSMTLLDMALAAFKEQWFSGEAVWIYGKPGQPKSAYLKEGDQRGNATVWLCVTGAKKQCPIFTLGQGGWQVAPNVERNYQDWKNMLQAGR